MRRTARRVSSLGCHSLVFFLKVILTCLFLRHGGLSFLLFAKIFSVFNVFINYFVCRNFNLVCAVERSFGMSPTKVLK